MHQKVLENISLLNSLGPNKSAGALCNLQKPRKPRPNVTTLLLLVLTSGFHFLDFSMLHLANYYFRFLYNQHVNPEITPG